MITQVKFSRQATENEIVSVLSNMELCGVRRNTHKPLKGSVFEVAS